MRRRVENRLHKECRIECRRSGIGTRIAASVEREDSRCPAGSVNRRRNAKRREQRGCKNDNDCG